MFGRPRNLAASLALVLAIGLVEPGFAGDHAGHQPGRTPFTAEEAAEARPEGLPPTVRFDADSVDAYRAWTASAPRAGTDPWLVLSGGGENGAFGAGLLNGWSEAGTRPAFGVVTGVSTGAMIAPFAFVGSKYDRVLRETYTGITAADVFEFGGADMALLDTWPLRRLVDRFVTPELLADVAAAHRDGRRLVIVTTNIDTQRPVAWDMGAIAVAGGPKAVALFREIVMASAAVPGMFPPVQIPMKDGRTKTFDEMHVDGGTTSPFFLAPAATVLGEGGAFPGREVYLVVNGTLRPDFDVTERTMLSVLGRAMGTAVRAQTIAAIAVHRAFARRSAVDLKVATVDARFKRPSPGPFDRDYMRALFDHAEGLGRAGTVFDPPGAEMGPASGEARPSSAAHQQRRADLR